MRSPSTGHHRAPSPRRPWRRRAARGAWLRSGDVAALPRLLAALPSLPRAELARLTERMIDRMDEIDGDPDLELNGDELDGTGGEDDFIDHNASWLGYPGCPVSDPGEDTYHPAREHAYE